MPQLLLKKGYNIDFNQQIIRHLDEQTAKILGDELTYQHLDRAFYLEDEEEQLKGGLIAHISWGIFHVKYLWVAPDYRGQGCGRALLEQAEQEAKKLNCSRISLQSSLLHNREFYTHLGFEEVSANTWDALGIVQLVKPLIRSDVEEEALVPMETETKINT